MIRKLRSDSSPMNARISSSFFQFGSKSHLTVPPNPNQRMSKNVIAISMLNKLKEIAGFNEK